MQSALLRVRRAWREARTDPKNHLSAYLAWKRTLAELGYANVAGLRVLELGCGERGQLSLLMALDGARVTAIDTLPVEFRWRRPRMWLTLFAEGNYRAAIRQVARDLFHTFRYWKTLASMLNQRLPFEDIDFQRASVEALPFASATFDLVVSSAVWEHIENVESATVELARVLKPSGLSVTQIALFPALQGGHHGDWHDPSLSVERRVQPWDHLLPGRRPFPTFLNEWQEDDYRAVFERVLSVIRWEDGEFRGREYLTQELRMRLADYSERALLLSSVTVWAVRQSNPNEVRLCSELRPSTHDSGDDA